METQVKTKTPWALVPEYKWRDKHGNMHRIEEMETRHLFHVVRMVWDHSMPRDFQTAFPRRYRFPEFYTVEYMALSVRLMLPELFSRKDITPEMWYWLEFMRNCLTDDRLRIDFVRKVEYRR